MIEPSNTEQAEWPDTTRDYVTALQAENEKLRELLAQCADQFRFYQQSHSAKRTPDGDEKAATNRQWADRIQSALEPKP